jgi:rhodanese-related sulfurtransferase
MTQFPTQLDARGATVIDVRRPDEYDAGHLAGALNLDWMGGRFLEDVEALPKDGRYIVYCKSGGRAGKAAAAMGDLGFGDVTNAGGLEDAAASTGLPVVVDAAAGR